MYFPTYSYDADHFWVPSEWRDYGFHSFEDATHHCDAIQLPTAQHSKAIALYEDKGCVGLTLAELLG